MADNAPIIIGQVNEGSNETSLTRNEATEATVFVAKNLNPVRHRGGGISGETNDSTSYGVQGTNSSGPGVSGLSASGVGVRGFSSFSFGVSGLSTSDRGGVFGYSEDGPGVVGTGDSGSGVSGFTSDGPAGVSGRCDPGAGVSSGSGVDGYSRFGSGVSGTSGSGVGVSGVSGGSYGVYGQSASHYAVYGKSTSQPGVYGQSTSGSGVSGYAPGANGVHGSSESGNGVRGNSNSGIGVYGRRREKFDPNRPNSVAGYFEGGIKVVNGPKAFQIDHPLDPQNKYLVHNAVESSEMKNVYDGVARLDKEGAAWVELPEWFEALNGDFRYQLTAVGGSAPHLHVAEEIYENRFKIAGGEEGMKVCWQVTGTRKDRWAAANPFVVEQEKPQEERGRYLEPSLYDAPEEQRVMIGPGVEAVEEEQRPPEPSGIDFARLQEEHRREMEELRRRMEEREGEAPPEST